jgi:hypothetical protein
MRGFAISFLTPARAASRHHGIKIEAMQSHFGQFDLDRRE